MSLSLRLNSCKSLWVRWYTVVWPRLGSNKKACDVHISSKSPTTSAVRYPEDRSRTTLLCNSWHLCCVSTNCWHRRWISSPATLASWRNSSILFTSKEACWRSMSCSFPTNPARCPDGTPPITEQAVAGHLGTSVEKGHPTQGLG